VAACYGLPLGAIAPEWGIRPKAGSKPIAALQHITRSNIMDRSKFLSTVAKSVSAVFIADREESVVAKTAKQERTALLFASIKSNAQDMTDGERVAVTYAFGVEAGKAGMSPASITVRRSELLFILENYALIPDGANAWRKTVEQMRRSLKSARDNLVADIEAAKAALEAATKRLAELEAEYCGLENAEAHGVA
jgi:hypothetical protein